MSHQINGAVKQDGTTGDMIFRIPRLIEHISSIMALEVCLATPLVVCLLTVLIGGRSRPHRDAIRCWPRWTW